MPSVNPGPASLSSPNTQPALVTPPGAQAPNDEQRRQNFAVALAANGAGPLAEAANRSLTVYDAGANLICAGSLTFVVPSGLGPGFGVSAKGTVAFVGGAGVTVTDVRTTGATDPWCSLCRTSNEPGAEAFDVVGTKA